jgi:C-terminal processing protease CtpA/Prc
MVGHTAALSRLGSSLRWRGWARLAAGLQYAASRVMVDRPWYPDTPMPTERVVLDRGGRRIHLTLKGARLPPRAERLLQFRSVRCGGVLRVGTFAGPRPVLQQRLARLLTRARGTKALVVDLRGNRGGALGLAHWLVARLIARPVVVGEVRYRRSPVLAARVPLSARLPADPKDSRWTTWQKQWIKPAGKPLGLPMAVLTDELCASACEAVASALSGVPGVLRYGRSTAGSSGLPVTVILPHSRLTLSLPSWQARGADGRLIEGQGVRPQVRVPLSLEALRAGRDEPLERALEGLCKGLASDRGTR